MITSHNLPFLIHLLVEIPASLNFFLSPSATLLVPQPYAHALIKQYAVLLLSTNLIALIFVLRPLDDTGRQVAGALAIYHFAAAIRAGQRMTSLEVQARRSSALGGPVVHWLAHWVCVGFLGGTCMGMKTKWAINSAL